MDFSESFVDYMKKAGVYLKDAAVKSAEVFIRQECNLAKNEQRYNDIIISVVALSDRGAKDQDLYASLSKFWDIDSRNEATEYINIGRHVEWPYIRLKLLLKKNGYDNLAVVKYMNEHNVREKLKGNSKLCELSDEKLKIEIEKI